MQLEYLTFITPEEIRKAIDLDHRAFEPGLQITSERAIAIYENAPESLIVLKDGDEWIGSISIFGITKALIESALSRYMPIYELIDKPSMRENPKECLYLHSIAITPEMQGKGLFSELKGGLSVWMSEHGGYSEIYADAVSAKGLRALTRMGFSEIASVLPEGKILKAKVKDLKFD